MVDQEILGMLYDIVNRDKLIKDLVIQGYTTGEIARIVCCSEAYVVKVLNLK